VPSDEEETDFPSTPDPRRCPSGFISRKQETKVLTWQTEVPRATPVALKQIRNPSQKDNIAVSP
jgi:hypothetical protein